MSKNHAILVSALLMLCYSVNAQESNKNPGKQKVMTESLLQASPTSLSYAISAARKSFLSDRTAFADYVLVTRLLIQRGLTLVREQPDLAVHYTKVLIGPTYDLSAAIWPGWVDANPGAQQFHAVGLELAQLNLRLREQLSQGPSSVRRGHWLLAIHLIADGNYQGAVNSFERSLDLAKEGGEVQVSLMTQGWIHVSNILAGSDERDALETVKARLKRMDKEGTFYASQYEPALEVFRTR